jgi:glutaredoxin
MVHKADLYRMITDDHVCPYGIKARALLERQSDLELHDHALESREETDAFKEQHGVDTTPQVFIDGRRIGGYEDLKEHLGLPVRDDDATRYAPLTAAFGTSALMALAATWAATGTVLTWQSLRWFVAFSMCVLAIQKLRDLSSFTTGFVSYDLLARRVVRYAYVYPFLEAGAGILMIAGVLPWVSGPVALFIGTIGAASVIKAVYLEGRELQCACMGGDSQVPLGAISLTENLSMMAMGIVTLAGV